MKNLQKLSQDKGIGRIIIFDRHSMVDQEFKPLPFNSIQSPSSKASQFMQARDLRKMLLSGTINMSKIQRHKPK